MIKKFKDIVKRNPEPAKGKFGINPMDPWSIKSGIAEATDKKDQVILNIPLLIRVLELAREDIKTDMDLHRVVEKLINIHTSVFSILFWIKIINLLALFCVFSFD